MSTTIQGPQVGYVDILDVQTIEAAERQEQEIKNGNSPYNPLRPSSAGRCTRELAYALMEYTKQTYYEKSAKDPEVVRLLNLGHHIEDSIIKQFEEHAKEFFEVRYKQQSVYGFSVTSEKFPNLTGLIEGSIDACFWAPDSRGIIDFKSKKDKYSTFFKSNWDETDEKLRNMKSVQVLGSSTCAYWVEDLDAFMEELHDPFFEMNFWQLNFYCNTVWAVDKGITHGAIIQYNKNDSRLREVRFKPSRKLYEKMHQKFQSAIAAADLGDPKLAPRDHNFGSIKCAFCPYSQDCWSNKDALQAYFDTFPKKAWPQDSGRLGKKLAQEFAELYTDFQAAAQGADHLKRAEDAIVALMIENEIKKIRFPDGKIYQLKELKSPRPHFELRRTKL